MGSFCLVRLLSGIAAADGVVVLQLAASWEEPGSEQRLVEEPSLALNEFAVSTRALDGQDSVRAALTAQVERVRPRLGDGDGDGDAEAVAWLDRPGPGQLGLAIVFVTDDRAVVRLLQAEAGPDAETGLALKAREILWSALGAPEVPPPAPESVAGCRGPRNLRDVACTPS